MPMQISGVTIQGGMNILPRTGAPSPTPSPTPGPSDPDFSNVVFMFDGDGTDGSANNTFTDSSTNGHAITENGDVTQGSFSPYGDNWSVYFDDTTASQYLQIADNSAFDATSSLCIEAWFYMTSAPGDGPNAHAIVNKWVSTTPGQRTIFIDIESTGLRVALDIQGASNPVTIATDGGAISQHEWHHVAVTWDGSTYRAFLDGVLEGSTSNSNAPVASSQPVRVGYNTNTHWFGGYISNVRWVTNGGAVYTNNFTPPTEPLTAISGTALLLNSSNRFVDESTNNHTVTVNGTPEVTPFSPFKNDDARDITTDGGSGYFDTSSAYLQIPTGYLPGVTTGDFTIEGWWYFDDFAIHTSYFQRLWSFGTGLSDDVTLNVFTNGDLCFRLNDDIQLQTSVSGGLLNLKEWNHIALVRSSGAVNIYVNGTSVVNGSFTANISTKVSDPLYIGSEAGGGGGYFSGYCSDVRVLDSAVYTSAFTPPSSPLTAITNTELLLNFQDSAIYDYSGQNNIDTIGDAQIDTAIKKYGTGSVKFDGSSDYLELLSNENLALSTGDFTIEFWAYANSTTNFPYFIDGRTTATANEVVPALYINNGNYEYWVSGAARITGGAFPLNQWVHVALVRNGNTTTLYSNGTSTGSFTDTYNYVSNGLTIGQRKNTSNQSLDGYLDDFRITKGIARYTTNFTPPTAALPKF